MTTQTQQPALKPLSIDVSPASEATTRDPKAKALIELRLFAPYNEVVELIGNFSDWKPIEMKKGDDGWWRANVELADGDYLYKFRVKSLSYFAPGQMMDVFDPYAVSITSDAKEETILRVRNGQRLDIDYKWQHDDKPLPTNRDVVIYELHVGDFSGGDGDKGHGKDREKGQFKHVIEKLDYLRDLGVTCLELMPVKEFPGKGWGYCLRSLFAVESSYGSPEELCRLVDECHARGIRVIIDGVYNHAEAEAPLTKIDYEYWFYNPNPDPPDMQWGPKFNYGKWDEHLKIFPARKYVIESIQFWVDKFHIDGIRFDATYAIKNFDILRKLADAAFDKVGGIKPFICISEHVPEDPAITGRPDEGPMNAAWHDSLGRLLQAIMTGQERDGFQPWDLEELAQRLNLSTNGFKNGDRVINFITNHDFPREMHMLADDAQTFDDAAFRRCKMAKTIQMTIPGMPMIWMGTEFGFAAEKTLEPRPIDWTLLKNGSNQGLLEHTKAMAKLRHENPALRGDNFEVVLQDQERLLFGYKRWNAEGNVIVVVANLKDEDAGEFALDDKALEDGDWREAVWGYDLKVEGGVLKDTLGRSDVKVYIKK